MLTKVSNSALLNFEEMYTFLLEIEVCLNFRPLTILSSDPSDLSVLTVVEIKNKFQIGELVLINMNNTPPLQWPLGRFTKLFPGTDQTVGVLTVQTKYELITQSINKVYLLPI